MATEHGPPRVFCFCFLKEIADYWNISNSKLLNHVEQLSELGKRSFLNQYFPLLCTCTGKEKLLQG
mgnify:CR=1 FL=1